MNINFTNLYKTKQKLFDGLECDYLNFVYQYLCPFCFCKMAIKPSEAESLYMLDEITINKLAAIINGLILKDTPVYTSYYTYKGLGLTKNKTNCSNKHGFLMITANGEYQPGRYVVINLGVFEL